MQVCVRKRVSLIGSFPTFAEKEGMKGCSRVASRWTTPAADRSTRAQRGLSSLNSFQNLESWREGERGGGKSRDRGKPAMRMLHLKERELQMLPEL